MGIRHPCLQSNVWSAPNDQLIPNNLLAPKESSHQSQPPGGRRRPGHRGLRGAHAAPRRQPRAGVPGDRHHDAPGQAPLSPGRLRRPPHVRHRGAPRRVAVHRERSRRPRGGPRPRDPTRGSRRPPPGRRRAHPQPAPSSSTASASSTRARCASCSPSSTTRSWPPSATPSRRWIAPRSALPHADRPLPGRVPSTLRKDPA